MADLWKRGFSIRDLNQKRKIKTQKNVEQKKIYQSISNVNPDHLMPLKIIDNVAQNENSRKLSEIDQG